MTTLSSPSPSPSYNRSLNFYTLELSKSHPELLVAALENALVTVHKVTGAIEILAGEPEEYGYVEGVGRAARFRSILGISQLEYKYILSDNGNQCLRSVDYISNEAQTFAGLCGQQGDADGSLVSARFYRPSGMTRDPGNPDVIYLIDSPKLRKIDLAIETVRTLPGSIHVLGTGITMDPAGGLLVTSSHGVKQYNFNGSAQWLTNSGGGLGCNQCNISSAKFIFPEGLRFITPEVLLVADGWNGLRLIDLTSEIVTTIGPWRGQDGPYQDITLSCPHSIAVDNSYIYIGECADRGGGVRKLAYTGTISFLHRFNKMQCYLPKMLQ